MRGGGGKERDTQTERQIRMERSDRERNRKDRAVFDFEMVANVLKIVLLATPLSWQCSTLRR